MSPLSAYGPKAALVLLASLAAAVLVGYYAPYLPTQDQPLSLIREESVGQSRVLRGGSRTLGK